MDWSIKHVTKTLGVTARALRYYETRGMLTPRRIGALRYYDEAQRGRIRQILRWKELGFSLGAIEALLAQAETVADDGFDPGRIADQIDFLTRRKEEIAKALSELRKLQGEAARAGASVLGNDEGDSRALTPGQRANRTILNLHRADDFTRKGA